MSVIQILTKKMTHVLQPNTGHVRYTDLNDQLNFDIIIQYLKALIIIQSLEFDLIVNSIFVVYFDTKNV